jgi:hypothetical protein
VCQAHAWILSARQDYQSTDGTQVGTRPRTGTLRHLGPGSRQRPVVAARPSQLVGASQAELSGDFTQLIRSAVRTRTETGLDLRPSQPPSGRILLLGKPGAIGHDRHFSRRPAERGPLASRAGCACLYRQDGYPLKDDDSSQPAANSHCNWPCR